jgi:hypothetical protein
MIESARSGLPGPSEFGSGDFDRVGRTLLSVAFDFDSVVDSDFDRERHGLSHAASQMVPASADEGSRFPLEATTRGP